MAALYDSRWAYWYVRTKLGMDPVARAAVDLASAEPFGDVLDIGAGRGQLPLLLAAGGLVRSITGVDWDEGKVALANAAAVALDVPARFAVGDVREAELPVADTVLLVDVLHYLAPNEQDALLVRAARAARSLVLVRDVDPERGGASTLTRTWERVTTSLGYNRGARVEPRSFGEIEATLQGEGFDVERDLCSTKGLSNVLLVARRRKPTVLP